LAIVCGASLCEACPACKEAVAAQSSEQRDVAAGYAASIGLLLAMPAALLVGGMGVAAKFGRSQPQQRAKAHWPAGAAAESVEESRQNRS
jgi:hypothetical protein